MESRSSHTQSHWTRGMRFQDLIFKAWKHPDGLTPWLISYPSYKVEKHKCTMGRGGIWLFTEREVFFSMPFVTVLVLLALETSQFLKMSFNLVYSKFFLFFPHLFFPAKLMHKMFPLGSNYTVVKNTLFFKAIVSYSILQLTFGLYSSLSLMNVHILRSLLFNFFSNVRV